MALGPGEKPDKKLLYSCGHKPTFLRNKIFLNALRDEYTILPGYSIAKRYILRLPIALALSVLNCRRADIIFVGYMGHFFVPVLRALTKKTIIFDAFLSLYDMVCHDRKLLKPESFLGRALFLLEKYSYRCADKILIDTATHKKYLVDTFGISEDRIEHIFLGADETIFYDRGGMEEEGTFRVHFHGTFIPLQGVEYIVKAAKLLEKEKEVVFHLYGGGQTFKDAYKLAEKLQAKNVHFEGFPSMEAVAQSLAKSHLGLGVFGGSDKAKKVIPTKGYETIAMKKPLLTGDSAAIKELLENNVSCYTCNFADETDLAKRILEIRRDANRQTVAAEGFRKFRECASFSVTREKLLATVNAAVKQL